jgi:hypothetical protein
MPEAWTAEQLAAATGEPVDRLAAYAEAGLLLLRAHVLSHRGVRS